MKKIAMVLLLVGSILSLSACQSMQNMGNELVKQDIAFKKSIGLYSD